LEFQFALEFGQISTAWQVTIELASAKQVKTLKYGVWAMTLGKIRLKRQVDQGADFGTSIGMIGTTDMEIIT
jgi:hypothetical protein